MRRLAQVLIAVVVLVVAVLVVLRLFAPVPATAPVFMPESVTWASSFGSAPDGGITRVGTMTFFSQDKSGVAYNSLTNSVVTVIEPSNEEDAFDRDYAAPGAVVLVNGEYAMFYHAERHECEGNFPFVASIGLATSQDGVNWTRQGQVLRSWEETPGCIAINAEGLPEPVMRPSGVGYPTVAIKDGFAYLFFVGWYPNRADGVYAARCEVSQITHTDCWNTYFEGEWSQPGLGGQSTQVLGRSSEEQLYLATPQIQIVDGSFVGVFETNLGFVFSRSIDGIEWSDPVPIFAFPVPHVSADKEQWYSYPSLLQDGDDWFLYYGQEDAEGEHFMQRQQVVLPE